jgi:hypothetical protein
MSSEADESLPPPLDAASWHLPDGRWSHPLILVPDRASLAEVLRVCGRNRFDEAYAFLLPDNQLRRPCPELEAVLGPYTQRFSPDELEHVQHVYKFAHVLYHHTPVGQTDACVLMVLEYTLDSIWRRMALFNVICGNAHTYGITLIVVSTVGVPWDLPLQTRANADAIVAPHRFVRTRDQSKAFDETFAAYETRAAFDVAHEHARAQGARLVWLNTGKQHEVQHAVCSLVVPPDNYDDDDAPVSTRDPFQLAPKRHMLSADEWSLELAQVSVYMLLAGIDTAISQAQAVQVFRYNGNRPASAFAASRHHDAMIAYETHLAHVHTALLEVNDTPCGHLPRVLCDLIVAYL